MTDLESLLAEHQSRSSWGCSCGYEWPGALRRQPHGHHATAYRAHVAALIRGWLLSDAVIERAARGIAATNGDPRGAARAALTAAMEDA